MSEARRSGFVALAGRPNVGKSTLVNRLVGEHVAAVSPAPQTTRRRTLGVVNGDGFQAVLVDLPGFQRPFDRLTERMQRSVDEALADVDATMLVLNVVEGVGRGDRFIAERVLREGAPPALIVVNKVDRATPAQIAPVISEAATLGAFHALHPVSALTGDGVDALLRDVVELLPEGPAYFPVGVTSDQPLEQRIGEIVREQALLVLREELPHAIAVEVEPPEDEGGGSRVVEARLICETESQKGILIGRRGARIKAIGSAARPEIERILGGPVFLRLTVKVRPKWRRDAAALDRLGV